jgi:IclR family transcriptional regulator, pca regulon regulatory protein
MTLTTVAKRNGLSPGSARRVLHTLLKLGYVGMKGQRFHLAARTLKLGYSFLSAQPIVGLIQPKLSALSEKLNESCSLSILDGRETVCIARATARRLERDYMGVGTRWPAHATSSGKLLLGNFSEAEISAFYSRPSLLTSLTPFTITDLPALLQQVEKARRDGWCYINQETAMGIASLAVAIRVDGEVLYALGISVELNFAAPTIVERYLPDLLGTATTIANVLATKA